MKVLFAASECVPFFKSGGLADVIGSLPKALKSLGIEVRVVLPKYQTLAEGFKTKLKLKAKLNIQLGWRNQYCGVEELEYQGLKYYFLDNEFYFKRDSLYGYFDEAERFIYFSRAVLKALPYLDFRPDIIHVHDWQVSIVPLLLKAHYSNDFFYQDIKTVLTIHNLEYQGVFPKEILPDLLDLSYDYLTMDKLEFNNDLNLLKGGIVFCDSVTTVSPTYALEIQDPFYGKRLDGLLRSKPNKLKGIINGIDYSEWDPEKDSLIYEKYSSETMDKKLANKTALQKQLGLKEDPALPVLAIISRLVNQKGLDLIECVLNDLLERNLQLIVLGQGEEKYERLFKEAAKANPYQVSANIRFDNELAHRIYAGADFLLMPSLFEPCGLSQLIALRYGTLPIVRETGGLKDTVLSFNESSQEGNGFSFANYNAHDMLFTIDRSLGYYNLEPYWSNLRKTAIASDNSWTNSAKEYLKVYASLLV